MQPHAPFLPPHPFHCPSAPPPRHGGALRCAAPQCGSGPKWADDEFDSVALYGDTCVLLAYGTVQGMIDSMFAPLAALDGDIGEAFQAVPMAPLQGIALAVMWVGITYAIGGYKTDATRTLPSKEALLPLGIAWTGAASVVVSAFVLTSSLSLLQSVTYSTYRNRHTWGPAGPRSRPTASRI